VAIEYLSFSIDLQDNISIRLKDISDQNILSPVARECALGLQREDIARYGIAPHLRTQLVEQLNRAVKSLMKFTTSRDIGITLGGSG
jgi:hypothetical protein